MKNINSIETLMMEGKSGEEEDMVPARKSPLLMRVREMIKRGELETSVHLLRQAERNLREYSLFDRGYFTHLKCIVSHKQGKYLRSIEEGEEACTMFEELGHTSLVGDTRRVIAKSRVLLGLLDQAILDFEESLLLFRKSGDSTKSLLAMNDLAQAYFIQGKWQLVRELLERGLRKASLCGEQSLIYSFTMNLGTLSFTRSNAQDAKRYFDSCTELLSGLNGASSCRLLIMKGNLAFLMEDLESARDFFESARCIAQEKDLKRELALTLEGSSEVAMERGALTEAECMLDTALDIAMGIAPRGDLINELLRRKGDAALRGNRYAVAQDALERSIAISRHLGDRLEEGAAHGLMGEVYCRMGKVEEARERFEKGIEKLTGLSEKWERARLLLRASIALRELLGADEAAGECLEYLDKAAELFDDIGLGKSRALVDLERGKLLFELEVYDRAAQLALQAFDRFGSDDHREEQADAGRLLEEIENTLARRSVQRSSELMSGEVSLALTVSGSELSQRTFKYLDTIRHRCLLDGACLAEFDSRGQPVSLVTSRIDEDLAVPLLVNLLACAGGSQNAAPALTALHVETDERYRVIEEIRIRGVRSFVLWSTRRAGGVKRCLYLDRRDPRKGALSDSDLTLIEAMAKDLVLGGSPPQIEEQSGELRSPIDLDSAYRGIITCSHRMLGVLRTVEMIKNSSIPVLLEGETGTGKELIARAIHRRSRRRDSRFIAVNCAAIPENLLESELFGHRRGAFTGAVRDKVGLFEVANGGTFFLDEIGDMGFGVQVKLLRFLEEGEFKRLGDIDVRRADVRVVSATNKTLSEEVDNDRFRNDLFYRLNGIRIRIPPLRERKEDIPLLVDWYLNRHMKEEGKWIQGIRRDAMDLLMSFDWPGNVRELVNDLRRALMLAREDGWITPANLADKFLEPGTPDRSGNGRLSGDGPGKSGRTDLPSIVARFERQKILDALRTCGGIKLRAARSLGVHEATLRGKIRKYRIGPTEWEI